MILIATNVKNVNEEFKKIKNAKKKKNVKNNIKIIL